MLMSARILHFLIKERNTDSKKNKTNVKNNNKSMKDLITILNIRTIDAASFSVILFRKYYQIGNFQEN